jgi:hypothetical protein
MLLMIVLVLSIAVITIAALVVGDRYRYRIVRMGQHRSVFRRNRRIADH